MLLHISELFLKNFLKIIFKKYYYYLKIQKQKDYKL